MRNEFKHYLGWISSDAKVKCHYRIYNKGWMFANKQKQSAQNKEILRICMNICLRYQQGETKYVISNSFPTFFVIRLFCPPTNFCIRSHLAVVDKSAVGKQIQIFYAYMPPTLYSYSFVFFPEQELIVVQTHTSLSIHFVHN